MAVMTLHRKLLFFLVVFLPTQLGYHFWPNWSSILGRKIDYLSPTVYVTDILVIALIITWIIETKLYKKIIFIFRSLNSKTIFMALCTSIFIFINIIFAHNGIIALIAWIKLLELVIFCSYVYQQRLTLADIIKPLAVGIVGIATIGISQYILQRSIGGALWFLGERSFVVDTPAIARITICQLFNSSCELKLRAYSTFSHPNVLGGFLAATLPLILVEVMKNNQKRLFHYLYVVAIILGAIALVLSFSRSAWVVSVFSTISIIIFRHKPTKIRLCIISILCLVMISGFIVAPIQDESIVVRRQLNESALSIWHQSPIVGIGLNNFLFGLSPTLRSQQVYILQPVHNIYLLLLSQVGLMGVSIILGYILSFIYDSRKRKHNYSSLYISMISLLMLGLIDHYLFTLQQGQLLFSLIISLTAVAIRFPSNS